MEILFVTVILFFILYAFFENSREKKTIIDLNRRIQDNKYLCLNNDKILRDIICGVKDYEKKNEWYLSKSSSEIEVLTHQLFDEITEGPTTAKLGFIDYEPLFEAISNRESYYFELKMWKKYRDKYLKDNNSNDEQEMRKHMHHSELFSAIFYEELDVDNISYQIFRYLPINDYNNK